MNACTKFGNVSISQNANILFPNASFPLKISSVNGTKSAISCGFGHIYWRKP